jgi:hypothetical protein
MAIARRVMRRRAKKREAEERNRQAQQAQQERQKRNDGIGSESVREFRKSSPPSDQRPDDNGGDSTWVRPADHPGAPSRPTPPLPPPLGNAGLGAATGAVSGGVIVVRTSGSGAEAGQPVTSDDDMVVAPDGLFLGPGDAPRDDGSPETYFIGLDGNRLDSLTTSASGTIGLLRMRAYYDDPARSTRLIVVCDAITAARGESIFEVMRENSAEGLAEYFANALMQPGWNQLGQLWTTTDPDGFAGSAEAAENFGTSLHQYLVADPIEKVAHGVGLSYPGQVAILLQDMPIPGLDSRIRDAKLCIELLGVVVGLAAGIPPLACASAKLLVHDTLKQAVVGGITQAIEHPSGITEPSRPVQTQIDLGQRPPSRTPDEAPEIGRKFGQPGAM